MTDIYLIRHAQSEGNLFRIMQGQWDTNVSEKGRAQVDALAERFRNIHIDAVYASDLFRTRYTAGALTRYHDVPVHAMPEFREIRFGEWETDFLGDITYRCPDMIDKFYHDFDHWSAPEAETAGDVIARTVPALKKIAQENDGKTVAVVSHGMAIRCLMAGLLGIPVQEQKVMHNTGVTLLHYDGRRCTVEYFDDYSHLPEEAKPSWGTTPLLRGESFRPLHDGIYYVSCYSDAWKTAHGTLEGFSAPSYLNAAKKHQLRCGKAVLRFYEGEKNAGIIDMDTEHGEKDGYGWISLLYLEPEYRGRGCAPQVLGRAMMLYRSLGRKTVRLTVADSNRRAIAFYRKNGFEIISQESRPSGILYCMEAPIESRRPVL